MSKTAQTLTDLRDKPDDELRQQLTDTRDELFRLQLGSHTNQVTSTALLTNKRRDIARILTVLNGRKAGLEAQAQKTATNPTASATEGETGKKSTKTKTKKAKS
jgi:ribosomal protein L29